MVDISALVPGSYIYEGSQAPLLNFRTALNKSASGIALTRILCVGDSTTVGEGSINGTTLLGADMKALSWPTQLARRLTSLGFNTCTENYFTDFGFGASAPTYDTRFVLGSWIFSNPTNSCFCGSTIQATATTASPASFTPATNTDTCEVYYLTAPYMGVFNWNVDGGANTTQSATTTQGVGKLTINAGSVGAHAYNFTWASGGQVNIIGFCAYDSTKKPINILNAGRAGTTVLQTISLANGLSSSGINQQFAALAPSLIIVQLGINDWRGPSDLTTFQTNLGQIIAAKPATAGMIWLSPLNSSTSVTAQATQDQYTSLIRSAATAAGMPYVDISQRNGGYAGASGAGMMNADGIHGNAYLYGDEANLLTNLLLNT